MPDPTTVEVLEELLEKLCGLAKGHADAFSFCTKAGDHQEAAHRRTEDLATRRCALVLSERIASLKASAVPPRVSDLPKRQARCVVVGGTMERWPVRQVEPVDLEDDDDPNPESETP